MTTEKHFAVAVKALIQNKNEEFLLLKKSDNEDIEPDTWDLPGGRVEFGENIYAALWREVKEETGLDIDIIKPTNVWSLIKPNLHLVGITFHCKSTTEKIELNEEHSKFIWADKNKLLKSKIPKFLKDEIRSTEIIDKTKDESINAIEEEIEKYSYKAFKD